MRNCYTEEELYWMTGGNTGTLPNRITPSKINILGENGATDKPCGEGVRTLIQNCC